MSIGSKFLALLLPAVVFSFSFCPGKVIADSLALQTSGETRIADARQITVVAGQSVEAKPLPPDTKPLVPNPEGLKGDDDLKPVPATAPLAPAAEVKPAALPKPVADSSKQDAQADAGPAPEAPSEFIKDDTAAVISPSDSHEENADGEDSIDPGKPAMAGLDVKQVAGGGIFAPIASNIRYFSVTVRKHFQLWLARSGKYIPLMKSILRENYMPEDLVFLALIESGFNNKAYSVARACGPWQFIKGTATRYGLKVDRWVDERRDPVKSTKAAAAYLKNLYGMFGSWPLAMASYNAGEGNVARAVTRTGGVQDFWELRKTRYMPSETKDYIPKFIAARMIAQNPDNFGFKDVEYEQPFVFEEVQLDRCTDLKTVARCCGVSLEDIKDLNPELIRGCTPPSRKYTLRIPKGKKEAFLAAYNAMPENERYATPKISSGSTRYVARRGDTLKKIAAKVGVPVARLASANHLKMTANIKRGRKLIIPGEEVVVASAEKPAHQATKAPIDTADVTPEAKSEAAADAKPEAKPEEKPAIKLEIPFPEATANADETVSTGRSADNATRPVRSSSSYRVRKGDTLASIARSHGTTTAKLAKLNGLGRRKRIKPGQTLALAGGNVKVAKASRKRIASLKKGNHKKYRIAMAGR